MAKETGTATDYYDLLQKLKNFITGASSPSSGLTWTVLREYSNQTSPESQLTGADIPDVGTVTPDAGADVHEIIFKGNGGESPELGIYFGIRTYQVNTNSLFNWEIRAYTGYIDSSPETDFHEHPGMSPPCYLPLQNTTMDYWFWATERRIIAVVLTGTNYQWMHIGLLNTFATASEYPYPMMIAGTTRSPSVNFSNNAPEVAGFLEPHGSLNTGTPTNTYPSGNSATAYLRWVDGVWSVVRNRYEQSGGSVAASTFDDGFFGVHPGMDPDLSLFPLLDRQGFNTQDFADRFYANAVGGTPAYTLVGGLGSPSPLPLIPLTVVRNMGPTIVGEIDGAYWVPGTGGLTSEDVVRDAGVSPEQEYICFQNVHRTDAFTFGAVRDD